MLSEANCSTLFGFRRWCAVCGQLTPGQTREWAIQLFGSTCIWIILIHVIFWFECSIQGLLAFQTVESEDRTSCMREHWGRTKWPEPQAARSIDVMRKSCLCLFPLIYSVWSFAVLDFCNCYTCCGMFVHFLLISCLLYCIWFEILDLFSSRFGMLAINRGSSDPQRRSFVSQAKADKAMDDISQRQLLKLIPGNGFFFRCTLIR